MKNKIKSIAKNFLLVGIYSIIFIITFATFFLSSTSATTITIKKIDSDHWTSEPFNPGFSVLEALSGGVTYGGNYPDLGYAYFPKNAVKGNVTIPVFLVDWNDFNPATDLSNPRNPDSIATNYKKHTREEISTYLNGPHGPADYFREVSGGQLNITFDVMPWMKNDTSSFLKNRSNYYSSATTTPQTVYMVQDILRSAVADWNVDFRNYDKDGNKALDGFVVLYEGRASPLSGTNLSAAGLQYFPSPSPTLGMFNLASLVPVTSLYYSRFQTQQVLYDRFINMPEVNPNNDLTDVSTWAHELGHLLLGYQDYYYGPTSLGMFALSAGGGHPTPFHMSGMEKGLFGKWINPIRITELPNGMVHTLTSNNITAGQSYDVDKTYLYKILMNYDPKHYLLLEYRNFKPRNQGGSFFNEQAPEGSSDYYKLESGLYIFEVDEHKQSSEQIKMLKPSRITDSDPLGYYKGAFMQGDEIYASSSPMHYHISNISLSGETLTFRLSVAIENIPFQAPEKILKPSTAARYKPNDPKADVLRTSTKK